MERIPDHPVIRSMERTGYPRRQAMFTDCDWCGCPIWMGDHYYNIHGEVLCADCVDDCKKEAE